VLRQRVRRHAGGVVGAAGDDGLIRVAIQEGDDDFTSNSGQGHKAILTTGPTLADPEPGTAVFVVGDGFEIRPRGTKKPQIVSNLRFLNLAERTGLEPATPGVTGRYSNQLNYRSKLKPCVRSFQIAR
jgi:hypothetical protein